MGHNNYSNFSKHLNKQEQPSHQQTIPVNEVSVEAEQEVLEAVVEQKATGKVINCGDLRVRKEGKKESDVLCTIEKDSEVQIDLNESTEEFYKVVTPSGIEGYCMKKFIEVK